MQPSRILSWYRSTFGQAMAGAVVLWAALPPLDLWLLGWVAPVWWLLLVRRSQLGGRRPYGTIWLAGFLFWMATLHWLRLPYWATSLGWVALSFYLAFYLPAFIALTRIAVHRLRVSVILAAPVVWTGLELARAHVLTGFSMAGLEHTQYRWIELIQISDLAGAYGVGFVVMFAAACLARMLPCDGRPGCVWPVAPLVMLLASVLVYGYARSSGPPPEPEARIALIQGSIDIELKDNPAMRGYIYKQYLDLSRKAVAEYGQLDLMVWPETMFPDRLWIVKPDAAIEEIWRREEAAADYGLEEFELRLRDNAGRTPREMAVLAVHLGSPMLLGVQTVTLDAAGDRIFNSAVLITREGSFAGRYDKMHPVMFGEYFPFFDRFPLWLQRCIPIANLAEGDGAVAFSAGPLRLAPSICYETILSHVIRRQVRDLAGRGEEPDVLVNLTNDGWFWGSSELDLHLICSVFRAVECRKPLLIAANTGFSAWIDPDGRIVAQGPRRDTGTILATVGREPRQSWYLLYGDWFAGCCLAACVLLAAMGCLPHDLAGTMPTNGKFGRRA